MSFIKHNLNIFISYVFYIFIISKTFFFAMGSQFTKDQKIDFSIHLLKESYYPGDYVDGMILINAKSDRPYSALGMKLMGEQNVRWTTGTGKHQHTYQNKKTIYDDEFIIEKFDQNKLQKGQHSFPFKFLLPKTMSGSLYLNSNCLINYRLVPKLTSIDKKTDSQWISQKLKIIQSFRGTLGAISSQIKLYPQCCLYFKQYGVITVNLICNKNCIKPGEKVYAYAQIINTFCTAKITKVYWKTLCHQYMISRDGVLKINKKFARTYFILEGINPGQKTNVQFQRKIFDDIKESTVIGSTIARFYTLELNFSVGLCNFQQSVAKVHIFIQYEQDQNQKQDSKNIKLKTKVKPPNCTYWQPLQHQKVVIQNLRSFVFEKNQKIPYQNQENWIKNSKFLFQMQKKISIKKVSQLKQSEQTQEKEQYQMTTSFLSKNNKFK